MPTWQIDRGGEVYEIEAPDEQSALRTLERQQAIQRGREQLVAPPGMELTPPPPDEGMSFGENARLATGRFVKGVPLAGPAIFSGAQHLRSALRGEDLANVQATDEDLARRNPGLATGAEIAGGVVGTVPMIAAAPALFGAGAGQSLLARLGLGGLSGGLLGGLDSMIRAPEGQKLDAAWKGAAIGGGVGAIAPLLASGVARGVSKAATAFRGMRPSGSAANRFAAAAARDRFNVDEFNARPPVPGGQQSETMAMDAGPAFQARAQAIAAQPGQASDILRNAAEQRAKLAEDMRVRLNGDPARGIVGEAAQVFNPMIASAKPARLGRSIGERAIQDIDRLLANTINDPAQRSFLSSLRTQIERSGGDPSRIHEIQSALGAEIRTNSRSNKQAKLFAGRLWPVRQALITQLDQSIAAGGQFSRGAYLQAQKEYAAAMARIEAIGPKNASSVAINRGLTAAEKKASVKDTAIKLAKGPGVNYLGPAIYGAAGGPGGLPLAAGAAMAIKLGRVGKAAFDRSRNAQLARFLTARPGDPIPSIVPPLDPAQTQLAIQQLLLSGGLGAAPKLPSR